MKFINVSCTCIVQSFIDTTITYFTYPISLFALHVDKITFKIFTLLTSRNNFSNKIIVRPNFKAFIILHIYILENNNKKIETFLSQLYKITVFQPHESRKNKFNIYFVILSIILYFCPEINLDLIKPEF